jgi:mannose-6-phosphate isomerase-like protein (cupin superfamily)
MKHLGIATMAAAAVLSAADANFLRRQIQDVTAQADDLTAGAKSATYRPLFGVGDKDGAPLKTVVRYGELTLAAGGSSATVSYAREEQLYYIEEGNGVLRYGDERAKVRPNDFMYLPVGVKHGIENPSGDPLKVIVMGYRIPEGTNVQPTEKLMLANADEVKLQILGQHGPTTQFQLLMGTTRSTRDRLSSAYVMDSLFIMDFAAGGTNIPHNHANEEEVYFLLRGSGDMVAGKDAEGKEVRYPVTRGAAFLFLPGCQVGYYSNAKEGQPHDLMLAVRSMLPRAPRQ